MKNSSLSIFLEMSPSIRCWKSDTRVGQGLGPGHRARARVRARAKG